MIRYFDYQPFGAAREIFRRRDPEVLLSGPAGTGKSRGILEKIHACAEKYPGSRQLIVRKTRASLTNTGLITYAQIVLPPNNAEVTYQQAQYPNGSIIDFGGMDKSSKIMSSEYDIIAVLEATELNENDWESLTTRLRWGRIPYQQIIGDCNPSSPTHFLKRRSQNNQLAMLESRHEDNPAIWDRKTGTATTKGAQYLSKLDSLTGVRYKRLRLGLWAAAEGIVYDGWDPNVHLVDRFEIPLSWPRAWVIDFGFTNPFVWQQWALDPDGRLFRYREIYHTKRLVEDHCRRIRELCKQHNEPWPQIVICDHDAEDRATFTRHMGMATIPAFKSVSPGVQSVQNRIKVSLDGKPRLYLMRDSLVERDEDLWDRKLPTCTEEEIEGYVWPGAGQKEAPVKINDHGMDAMRYMVAHTDRAAYDPQMTEQTQVLNSPGSYQISAI